jgi:anthranilate/para-aminobenzoate synthase component II
MCFTAPPSNTGETSSSISESVAPRPTRCASILGYCLGWQNIGNLEWGALDGRTEGCVNHKFERGQEAYEILVVQIRKFPYHCAQNLVISLADYGATSRIVPARYNLRDV